MSCLDSEIRVYNLVFSDDVPGQITAEQWRQQAPSLWSILPPLLSWTLFQAKKLSSGLQRGDQNRQPAPLLAGRIRICDHISVGLQKAQHRSVFSFSWFAWEWYSPNSFPGVLLQPKHTPCEIYLYDALCLLSHTRAGCGGLVVTTLVSWPLLWVLLL